MDNIKGLITGTIITLVVGGTAYTFSQEDVIQNFTEETGMTKEQAELYINDIPEEELATFGEVGSEYVADGQELLSMVSDIDCINYEYGWETAALSCYEGKEQIKKISEDTIALGNAYKKLESDSATKQDIVSAISHIEELVINNQLEISRKVWSQSELDENNRTNAYNKSILRAALESE